MSSKFDIVQHVLSDYTYANADGFDMRTPHEELGHFKISFHDLDFLDKNMGAGEILTEVADKIKACPVEWKEKKGNIYYKRMGRTEDCLAVVHDHRDHPHIHFIYPLEQLNIKKTRYIQRGFGAKYYLLKKHIKDICSSYNISPNYYMSGQERLAFKANNCNKYIKMRLSGISWQMKQNPSSKFLLSKSELENLLKEYINETGNASFVNKIVDLWNERNPDRINYMLHKRDQKLLSMLKEGHYKELLASINSENYRSIIFNDLIRLAYGVLPNILHKLVNIKKIKIKKSLGVKLLEIKKAIRNQIIKASSRLVLRKSIYEVFNKTLRHVMEHAKSYRDIHDYLQEYFDDIGMEPDMRGYKPYIGEEGTYIAIEKTLYKKKKYLRQSLIRNTLKKMSGFKPLPSVKKEIDKLRAKPTSIYSPLSTQSSSYSDLDM
jgi:hypothetical protein